SDHGCLAFAVGAFPCVLKNANEPAVMHSRTLAATATGTQAGTLRRAGRDSGCRGFAGVASGRGVTVARRAKTFFCRSTGGFARGRARTRSLSAFNFV